MESTDLENAGGAEFRGLIFDGAPGPRAVHPLVTNDFVLFVRVRRA
jgi:hypothetical protein